MEALLIDDWLSDAHAIPMIDDASVSVARQRVRAVGSELGLGMDVVEPMALVVSELGRNHLAHASQGRLAIYGIERAGVMGLEIVAADRGHGIVDPARALEGTPRVTGSLGVGLASVCTLAHEIDFDVRLGEGSCVWARRFAGEVPRRRQVGIFGRALAGESCSGDHGGFHRDRSGLTLALCDGLGHGPLARAASSAALATFHAKADKTPVQILEACDIALKSTRGAVMTVARIDEPGGSFEHASVGNVATHVYGGRTARRFGGSSFVIGSNQRGKKIQSELAPIVAGETLVMFTDGIRSQTSLETELALLREHPIVMAQRMTERFARDGDDVLVLVCR